jgi:hypothetical protein
MSKSVSTSLVAAAMMITVGASPLVSPPAAAQNPVLSNVIPPSAQVTIQARITAIDPAARTVTLVGANGNEVTLSAGPGDKLEMLHGGDKVTAQYYHSVAFDVVPSKPGNQAPVSDQSLEQAVTRGGTAPGGTAVRVIKIQATVVGIDLSAQNLDVVNPSGGGVYTIHVTDPERVAKLSTLKVGDTITAAVSQALVDKI